MKLTVNTSNIYERLILLLVLTLVFLYDALVVSIGFLDELVGIFSFFLISILFLSKSRIRLYRSEYYIALSLLFIAVIGLTSNIVTYLKGYTTEIAAIFGDFILFFKAFSAYFALRFFSRKFNSKKVLQKISKYTILIFYLLALLVIIDMIFKIYPHPPRYGTISFELFFKHPSRFGFSFAFIFLALLPKYAKTKKWLLVIVLLFGLLSLRIKFMGFILLSILFVFYGKKLLKLPRKVFIYFFIGFGIILIYLFWDWVKMYFSFEAIETGWSRAIVLFYSPIIATDFMPLGTGFGTYSCYYSGFYYSWVYELYEIDRVYGISKLYWGFVADQYWPMVLGQFGFFGFFAMFFALYQLYKLFMINIKAHIKNNKYYYFLSALLGFFLLLIDSTSDAIYTQQRAVVMFMFFALIVNTINQKHE